MAADERGGALSPARRAAAFLGQAEERPVASRGGRAADAAIAAVATIAAVVAVIVQSGQRLVASHAGPGRPVRGRSPGRAVGGSCWAWR